jgi:hypothetical protein
MATFPSPSSRERVRVRERRIAASRASRGQLESRVGQPLHLAQDRERDPLGRPQRLLVAEAEDADAGGRQRRVPIGVVAESDVVPALGSIDLDGEPQRGAEEVEREPPYGRLAAELGAEVSVAKDLPDASLRVGGVSALKATEIDRWESRAHDPEGSVSV